MSKFLSAIIFILFVSVCLGQTESDSVKFTPMYKKHTKYTVKTSSGVTYAGYLVNEDKDFITIESLTEMQQYDVRKSEIIFIKPFSDRKVYDDDLGPNYHAQTYMASSSSILFEKPDVSVNYQWLIFENINFSLGDHWDVTANTIFIYPYSIGIKCAYKVAENTYVGANVFAVASFNSKPLPNFLLGYGGFGRLSRGTQNKNFSISAGVLGINSALFQTSGKSKEPFLNLPFASFAYLNRFKPRWAICAEAFYFPDVETGFGGAGFKFLRDKFTSWTFGCFTYMSLVNSQVSFGKKFIPIPFIGYSRNLYKG